MIAFLLNRNKVTIVAQKVFPVIKTETEQKN